MNTKGLLVKPNWDHPEQYLKAGEMTQMEENIVKVAEQIKGVSEDRIIRNILLWMNENTERLHNVQDPKKFKRTASEILVSGQRTGCCDSSTLFTALARAKGIPAMQVLTWEKQWGDKVRNGERINSGQGHFFTACSLEEYQGTRKWKILDSDREIEDIRDFGYMRGSIEDRNIGENQYAFAYVNDFRDVLLGGMQIDSIEHMVAIQKIACKQADRQDYHREEKIY